MFLHAIQQLQSKYSVSTRNPAILCYSTYRINSTTRNLQEILQLQGSSHARHLPVTVSRASKHSTWQNPAIRLQALQTHTGRLPAILPGRNSILAAASIHTTPTRYPRCIPTEFYQEKQDSFQKGQVLHIYAILRSVCSKLLIRIILQEY